MRKHLARRRPSPAMAVAFVALLAALSGTAVALPGRNTVDSGDIKRGAVKNADIGRGAVTGSKIRNGTITNPKLRNGTLTGAKLANDTVTGEKVNESSLGTVPRAESAGTASTANNANAVNGHPANGIARVASASDDDDALVGVNGAALTTTITAPSAGFLVINAGADVFATANNTPTCSIQVDNNAFLPSDRTIQLQAGNFEENCTTEAVIQVTAGEHTVDFEFVGVIATTTVDEASLQALFVPFGSTGVVP
jgi:hypothetical protein